MGIFLTSFAQNTFYKSFDILGLNKVIRTHDNGFACVTNDGLLKLNSDAEYEFYKTYSNASSFDFTIITQTTDNGYIIGTRNNTQNSQELTRLVKFDKNGNYQWTKRYYYHTNTTVQTQDIIGSHDNGFYLMGSGCIGSPILLRCDQNGDVIWQKRSNYSNANRMIKFSDEAFIIAGSSVVSNNNRKVWVSMIDSSGNFLWQKEYNNNRVNFVKDIIQTGNNEISILINSQDSLSFISNATSSVLQINSLGNLISTSTISSDAQVNYHQMNSFAITQDDGFVFTGTLSLLTPGTKIIFSKTNSSNNSVWTNYFGNIAYNNAGTNEGIQIFEDGNGYIIFSRNEDGLSIGKIDGNGSGFCNKESLNFTSSREEFIVSTSTLVLFPTSFDYENIEMSFSNYIAGMTVHCSVLTSTSEQINPNEILCYPNPTSGQVFLEAERMQQLSIFDVNGTLKKQLTLNDEAILNVDMTDLPKGTYLFKVITDSGVSVRKVIYL